MRRLRPLAACGLLGLLLLSGGVGAQTTLTAPTIDSATAGTNSLAVAWTAPTDDGGSAVTSYDLRHILTSATDKADSNWNAAPGHLELGSA